LGLCAAARSDKNNGNRDKKAQLHYSLLSATAPPGEWISSAAKNQPSLQASWPIATAQAIRPAEREAVARNFLTLFL
jgi:hypothetical protein